MAIVPFERLLSNARSTYVAHTRARAIEFALAGGVAHTATRVDRASSDFLWPRLEPFTNDNETLTNVPPARKRPQYIWGSTTTAGQTLYFAMASGTINPTGSSDIVVFLTAFADNALNARVDLYDITNGTHTSLSDGVLHDGNVTNPANFETQFPYNWQNIRFYSINGTFPSPSHLYKVVVSFEVLNYDQLDLPGYVNPAALQFVTDIYVTNPQDVAD
ncbi:hypothetical protein LLE49_00725 [Alicyclobacillus tolerans]|uniref:hypothetical protein n=1 Tax=Alicyclobacillus tolerans TaxID=90970 RepID=UPI001F29FCAB|nr:hypothetical protein [Alicyclobacillus tolerans]MCF8563268.1 hypothetical protein [Alicyclobacillus tolerans]